MQHKGWVKFFFIQPNLLNRQACIEDVPPTFSFNLNSMKKNYLLFLIPVILSLQCVKNPADNPAGDYLRFGRATLHVANKSGGRAAVLIESTTDWQLTMENPVDWLITNRQAGRGTDSLVVVSIKDNKSGQYKFANIIATAVHHPSLLPVRLTVVQYDSTFKGN